MAATGLGPKIVDRTSAGERIEQMAITARASGHSEHHITKTEVLDHAGLGQTPCDLLGRFVLGFERINQPKPHQITQSGFDRHRAAACLATGAKALTISSPGIGLVDVDLNKSRLHKRFYPGL